jgi:hypothetical protein
MYLQEDPGSNDVNSANLATGLCDEQEMMTLGDREECNAQSSICLRHECGSNVIVLREPQEKKQEARMNSTEAGIEIDLNDEQLINAQYSIPEGKSISANCISRTHHAQFY